MHLHRAQKARGSLVRQLSALLPCALTPGLACRWVLGHQRFVLAELMRELHVCAVGVCVCVSCEKAPRRQTGLSFLFLFLSYRERGVTEGTSARCWFTPEGLQRSGLGQAEMSLEPQQAGLSHGLKGLKWMAGT